MLLPKIFVWNCQDCASPKFVKVVNDYFVEHEVVIAVFLETWVSGPKAEKIIPKLGLDFSHRVLRDFLGEFGSVGRVEFRFKC